MVWLRRIAKTVWICVSVVGLIAVALLLHRRRRSASPVREAIEETKRSLVEVRQEAVVEMAAARTQEKALKERLGAVKSISDRVRRREELLRLYQEVSE
jgi:hypothetical protein